MLVNLTYFKKSGKYYSSGSYITKHTVIHLIFDEVRDMWAKRELPDLIKGCTRFTVYIDPQDNKGYPAIINGD